MKRSLATAVSAFLVLQAGAAAAGGAKGRKVGVRRLSELRSGKVVVGQIVDLAPGFGRAPADARLGRDQHGQAMELDDSTPGQLRFRNRGADGLRVTDVHTWDGAARRWLRVKNGVVDTKVARAPVRRVAFIPLTVVAASGEVNRPHAGPVRSARLVTSHDRRSRVTRLVIDLDDASGRPIGFRVRLRLDRVNDALESGAPVEEAGWTIQAGEDALELRRDGDRPEVVRIARSLIDQIWAEADRDFPLAD